MRRIHFSDRIRLSSLNPFGGVYFGMAGDQEGLSINLSLFFPGDGSHQPSVFGNFAREEGSLPTFEGESRHEGDDPDVLSTDDFILTRLGLNVGELRESTAISLWIYRLKLDSEGRIGHDLIHVALSNTELNSLIDQVDESGDFDEENLTDVDIGSIIGRISIYDGEELVEVTELEVLRALDEAVEAGRVAQDSELASVWEDFEDWVRDGQD